MSGIRCYTEAELAALAERVRERLSGERFLHTLGAVSAAVRIGEYILPEQLSGLRAAALLHDIAKELSPSEEESLILSQGLSRDPLAKIPATRHALLAPAVISRDFPEFAEKEILSAVKNHTTGAPDMSIFDEIIFIADYIEEGRTYPSCIAVRDSLYSDLESFSGREDRIRALHRAVIASIDYTAAALRRAGRELSDISILTKNAISALI
ncbi:MAG: HD domain-containing protein [Clostridia bacterium]|nr:HD domain-containing protein [Clostridia bacterium]